MRKVVFAVAAAALLMLPALGQVTSVAEAGLRGMP